MSQLPTWLSIGAMDLYGQEIRIAALDDGNSPDGVALDLPHEPEAGLAWRGEGVAKNRGRLYTRLAPFGDRSTAI